ncbi:MAG: T9SS type A sorting domain-containing protein [Lewinellaceae bacterium]|nr:T9SS type A sorting domain-containing protein [Lewinellaceae bacterium]
MSKQLLFGSLIGLLILSATLFPIDNDVKAFHTKAERALLRQILQGPIDSTIIFPTAGNCSGCHGFDTNGYAMVDFFGNDVNIHDDWRATMMANAAKDPFWRAKVSHEILVTPAEFHDAIETKCTSCHAPNGHYTALYRGHGKYTMEDLLQDTIGLDGVTCTTCHKISTEQFGDTHSGDIRFDTNRVVYGPYFLPFAPPMADFVGLEPLFGDHVTEAGLCAPCHTLLTEPISTDGQLIGTTFVEQATYHEWLNSAYEQEQSCQGCHMPRLEEPIVISANYLFLEGRSPYGLHELAGANTFMLQLMKEHRQELGIDALPEHFDATIDATFNMLQNKSLYSSLDWMGVEEDTAYFELKLTNRAGHKFPSGYPSRRLFIEFVVETEDGEILFHSGRFNENYELMDENPGVEPHYAVINRPDQVQIYEMVAGNDVGNFTVVLEHAYSMLKDNRLPPRGFSTADEVYDTTRIVGRALEDENFNYDNGEEGSGSDLLEFHIPTLGYEGLVQVTARAYYHSLPPKWLAPIFAESTPQIDTFRHMFNRMDNAPVLVAEHVLAGIEFPSVSAASEALAGRIKVFPNPSAEGQVEIRPTDGSALLGAVLYNAKGKRIKEWNGEIRHIELTAAGLYFLHLRTRDGVVVKKLVRQ